MAAEREPKLLPEPRGGVPDVIDDLENYKRMCRAYAQADGPLAADAERASGFRYGQEDYLVQFKRQGAGIALVDPVALAKAGGSWRDFDDAVGQAPWIIHDSRQDLPGFVELGMTPRGLFDTELAARMLGLQHVGLAAVTEHYLGLSLAKEHSAADWSYRPLPRDWRNYAALDVELLIELEEAMAKDLKEQGKDEWARQEFDWLLVDGSKRKKHGEQPWRHISRINVLRKDRRGLAIARALWTRRDQLARELDISPSLLLSDAAIIEAAMVKPRNGRQFRSIRSLNERVRMHTGGEQDKMFERYAPIQRSVKPSVWSRTILEALQEGEDQLPRPPKPRQEGEEGKGPRSMKVWKRHPARYQCLSAARKAVAMIAQDTRTPSDIILKPQYLRDLCWTDEPERRDVSEFLSLEGARPWQVALVGESVSRAIM
ncbi:HRDC domain-containing protein [Bifidobacterium xylocopae]|uniref:Ribonuclease D n=1 Tax=Bifidobacterium xylocopae TaxID=2493119 RepID=A0A366KE96_9BIFI|nr:HRDC domain-containing protein [Bifidobacterium xylocopae]RBP99528.1 ribonuclease D [Bifidobacterium xylocopae]